MANVFKIKIKDDYSKSEKFVEKMLKENKDQLSLVIDAMKIFDNYPHMQMTNSSSDGDCHYLQLLCLEAQPQKILEIGTWCGKSAYYLAVASNYFQWELDLPFSDFCEVHTVDDNDRFISIEEYGKITENIIPHPNIHSRDFWKTNTEDNFDFVFVDGYINEKDCENIFEVTTDDFWFATHDYYDHNLERCKGFTAIMNMILVAKRLQKKGLVNYKHTLYTPNRDFIETGFKIPDELDFGYGNLNTCIAAIKFEKISDGD